MNFLVKEISEIQKIGPLFPLVPSPKSYNYDDISQIFKSLVEEVAPSKKNNQRGRILVANKDFVKGDVLFEENLFSFRVTTPMLKDVCNYTLGSPTLESILKTGKPGTKKLLKETSSRNAWFKSESTLREVWKLGHKEFVNGYLYLKKQDIPVLNNSTLMDSIYFAGQTYLAIQRAHKEKSVVLQDVYDLYCPFNILSDEEQQDHFSAAVIVTKFLRLNYDEHFEHKCKFSYFKYYIF